jgi:hypothetical protein
MPLDSFDRMVLIFSSGVGVACLGFVNALLRRPSAIVRVALSLLVVGVATAAAWGVTGLDQVAWLTGSILGGLLAVQSLAGSNRLAKAASSAVAVCRLPAIRWGVVGVFGFAAAVGSVVYEEARFVQNVDAEMAELEWLTAPPACGTPSVQAVTDAGREISIREAIAPRSEHEIAVIEDAIFSRISLRDAVIRRAPGSDAANCHGWVFTGARFWIPGTEVDRIIAENGYQVVSDPHAGDLVVYRSSAGGVLHSAVVRYVTESMPVLVEGKWGASGVYLHPVEKSLYGTNFQYYRSSRTGHLLAGLQPSDSNGPAYAIPAATDPLDPEEFTE